MAASDASLLPLRDVKVVDFGQYMAGPAVAMILADLGATVVHIDPPGGPLWEPNMLVSVRIPWMRLDGEMLIRQVSHSKDDSGGTTTDLELVSPQAFEPEPPDGKKGRKVKRKKDGDGANDWGATTGEAKNG